MVGLYLPKKPKFTFCYSALKMQIFLTPKQGIGNKGWTKLKVETESVHPCKTLLVEWLCGLLGTVFTYATVHFVKLCGGGGGVLLQQSTFAALCTLCSCYRGGQSSWPFPRLQCWHDCDARLSGLV
jgi:hypothetical protein